MSIDARGAMSPIYVIEGADTVKSGAVKSDGAARDLTNATLSIIVKDACEDGGYGQATVQSELAYSQTITDASGGLFTFYIPKEAYSDKEGKSLTWQLIITENDYDTALGYGPVYVQEAL